MSVSPDLTLHYRDNTAADRQPLLLLHSLSDSSFVFDAVIAAGLETRFRVIAPDLRGRGASSRPPTGYTLEHHCEDLIALLDHLGVEKAFIAGHSFGGLLALYFAAHYPQRSLGLAMIDAAVELHPMTPAFVMLLADRLGKWYPSVEYYISKTRTMPFITYWDEDMTRAFLSDTETLPDGSVYVRTQKAHIIQCALAVQAVSKQSWREWALRVPGPALVFSAMQPFLQGQHILLEQKALETAVLLPGGEHRQVHGNHITMMFGPGAQAIAAKILDRFAPAMRHAARTEAADATY